MTKDQLLEEFALMPDAKLQSLFDYATNIIIPDNDLLVDVNMVKMRDKAFSLADIYFPEWTDRSEADFGRFLIELIALFSEKDFYYINAGANENLLRKMNVYSNVFIRAIELGYSPILCRSASGSFNLTFQSSTQDTVYPAGSLIIELNDVNYKFTNLSAVSIPANASPTVMAVSLREGSLLSDTFTYNGSRIAVRKSLIDVESVRVLVEGKEWSRVRAFGQSASTSEHFIVLPEVDGQISIFFGEGIYGKSPDLNSSVKVFYLKGNGSLANNKSNVPRVNKEIPSRRITSVVLNSPTTGGFNPDSLEDLKYKAESFFSTRFSAMNKDTTELFLNSQTGVRQSRVLIQGNFVYFRVQPSDGSIANSTVLTALQNTLSLFINNGFVAVGLPTTYVTIPTVNVSIYHLAGVDVLNTEALVKNYISDYTNPTILAKYGKDFNLSDLAHLLRSRITGIQNVVFSLPSSDVTVNEYEILSKIPLSNINVTMYAV